MPIELVQSAYDLSGSFSLAYPSSNNNKNLLIVVAECSTDFNSTPYTISDSNNNIWTTLPIRIFPTTYGFSQLFYAKDCKSGVNTITLATGIIPTLIMIHEFSGVNELDVKSFALGTGLSQDSGSVITNFSDELLFGYEASSAQLTGTSGVGWNQIQTGIPVGLSQYKVVSSIGTYNSLSTTTVGKSGVCNWAAEILAFYEKPSVQNNAIITF